ncbi:MAG: putative transporter [Bacteroidaceae bacterium]|nr:putative transporter [Bacteroidaceae bacterium]
MNEWFNDTIIVHSAVQAVIIICLICAIGLSLGKIKFRGISLGVTFVFFIGILAGSLGLEIDPQMLSYAESFGLVLFVYTLGLQVGPGFISTFRIGGTQLNILATGVVLIGTAMLLAIVGLFDYPLADMMGVLCGATTNTPALGAAQQTLKMINQPAAGAALSCAVTYPLGMVGVIIALILMKNWMLRHEKAVDVKPQGEAFIASFFVHNPAVFGKSLADIAKFDESKFVITRLWRQDKAFLPSSTTVIEEGDRVLVITEAKYVDQLTVVFGKLDRTDWNAKDVDWNSLDARLVSENILVTRPNINGRRLGELQFRKRYGVNVSRVKRAGIQLVAKPDLMLRMGDRITVVGEKDRIKQVADELGNAVKVLNEPNMVTIFIGIVLGLLLGCIPFHLPSMSFPVRLGLAGGPIIMGILIGAYGPRLHMVAYTTTSANLMLRSLGLSMYLSCLGLDAGEQFLATVVQPQALAWIGWGMLITFVPVMIMGIISVVWFKKSVATTAGMLCGAMANPIALNYVSDTLPGDKANVAYASVYPLCMFLRVIIAQVIVMVCLG